MSAVAVRSVKSSAPPGRADERSAARPVRVALLGCGTVGSRVARALAEHRDRLARTQGVDLALVKVLVRDRVRSRPGIGSPHVLTDRFEDVLAAEPDVVIELLGGVEPAAAWIGRCLDAGIAVVTANKSVVAAHGADLRRRAGRTGSAFCHEAAVCAAVPVLAALRHLEGDSIESIQGVVNGSTNYILSRMSEKGLSLADALAEARLRGLVEPDPSADLSGRDAAEKLCILAGSIGVPGVRPESIEREGIERIAASDLLAARRHGYAIKLVAEIDRSEHGDLLRVGPTLVPRSHRLAAVDLESNGVVVNTVLGGELFLSGAGAGPEPTASAVLGDLLRAIRGERGLSLVGAETRESVQWDSSIPRDARRDTRERRWYVRASLGTGAGRARPSAVLQCFREAGVGVKDLESTASEVRVFTCDATQVDVADVCRRVREFTHADPLAVPALASRASAAIPQVEVMNPPAEAARRSA
jgi:homoserine dehydrogenase